MLRPPQKAKQILPKKSLVLQSSAFYLSDPTFEGVPDTHRPGHRIRQNSIHQGLGERVVIWEFAEDSLSRRSWGRARKGVVSAGSKSGRQEAVPSITQAGPLLSPPAMKIGLLKDFRPQTRETREHQHRGSTSREGASTWREHHQGRSTNVEGNPTWREHQQGGSTSREGAPVGREY